MSEHTPEKPEQSPPVDLEEVSMLMDMARKRDGDAFIEKQSKFLARIKKDYPDYLKWRVYHAFTHSGISEEEEDVLDRDFPGDDSVLLFLQKYLGMM